MKIKYSPKPSATFHYVSNSYIGQGILTICVYKHLMAINQMQSNS
jgi:hypothetical protein